MVMLSQIDSAVCGKYGIPPTALKGDSRAVRVARPRQVAMYLGRQLTSYSLPQLALWYGNRDHTTVLHGVRRVEALMAESTLFAVEVADLRDQLGGQKGTRRSKLAVSCRRFAAEHAGAEITTDLEQTG